jgi:hypothetical protein
MWSSSTPSAHNPMLIKRVAWWLCIGVALINLLIVTIVGLALVESRELQRSQASQTVEGLAAVMTEGLHGFIDKVELSLSALDDEITRQEAAGGIDPTVLNTFLTRLDTRLPGVIGHRVINAQGITEYAASNVINQRVSVADRDYFTTLRGDSNKKMMTISLPVLGRSSGKMVVAMAKRREALNREFNGIVVVLVPVDYFYRLISAINPGALGAVTLFNGLGIQVRYQPGVPMEMNIGRMTPSASLKKLIESERREAAYHARSGTDGVLRTFHFRKIPNSSLSLVVGLADEEYLAKWQKQAIQMGALALLFCAVTTGFAWAGYRGWRHYNVTISERTELLARSNADLEQFAYVASHDLQTPLRNVVRYAQLIEHRYKDQIDADANDFINFIVDGGKHMTRLINDLLDFSRVSQQPAAQEPISAGKAVTLALKNLEVDVGRAGAEVIVGELPMVIAEQT